MVPCMGTVTARTAAAPTAAAAARFGRPADPPGRGRRAQVGHPEAHRETPAVDLGGDVALHGRHLVLARRRRRRRPAAIDDQVAQVERVLDPLGRVGGRDEVGVAQDRHVAPASWWRPL